MKFLKPLTKNEKIIAVIIVIGIIWGLGGTFYGIYQHERSYKPLFSYWHMVNLAKTFDEFQAQTGNWPTNLNQIKEFQPDWSTNMVDSYQRPFILVPFDKSKGYGELISYGRDGEPGGENKFDRDIFIRFPTYEETNYQWNEQMRQPIRPGAH